MLQEWQALFEQLEITGELEHPAVMSVAELAEFETRTDIVLPASYKEFCQVFGAGILGKRFNIKSPFRGVLRSPRLLDHLELFPSEDPEHDETLKGFLDHALAFGDDCGENDIVWDLRTYSEADQSYDIYWTPTRPGDDKIYDDQSYLIGRDFFEFVRDFCIGTKSAEILPESKDRLTEPPPQVFFRYSPPPPAPSGFFQ